MPWKNKISSLAIFLTVACTKTGEHSTSKVQANNYHSTKHLIEAQDLHRNMDNSSIKIVDFRRKEDYEIGHISGAVNFWRSAIESEHFPFAGMVARKETMEELMSRIGLTDRDRLVIYDGVGSCDATRLWWVLKNYGFENVQILNGGIDAWKNIGGPVDHLFPSLTSTNFKFLGPHRPSSITSDVLLSSINSNETFLLLDTRTEDEFSGKRQKKGATSAGRIPGSIHIDWVENINFDGDRKFKSYEELSSLYGSLIQSENQQIITYCHTGVRSSHTYFVLTELLGYQNVKNYDGSWAEWSYKELPKLQDSVTVVTE